MYFRGGNKPDLFIFDPVELRKGVRNMKVVLAINSPEPYFPPQVPPRLCYGKKYPYNRMDEIVEYIETEGKKHRYKTKEITTEF